jgi:toxin ParE1/3/4
MQVVILQSAEQDLKELKTYILKNFNKDAWQTSYQKIQESIKTIQTFPQSGKTLEELEMLNVRQYRQVLAGMNRIIYEIRQQTIYIHIICDTRKDMVLLLTKRLLRGLNERLEDSF